MNDIVGYLLLIVPTRVPGVWNPQAGCTEAPAM